MTSWMQHLKGRTTERNADAARTEGTEKRWEALLEELGGFEEDYPLPDLETDAAALVARMTEEYATRKEAGTLPAKIAQINYASLIAQRLDMKDDFYELPRKLRTAVGSFIEEHAEAYRASFRDADGMPMPGPR